MTKISGGKLSGMRLDGAAFMSPMDLSASIWLKRGTGITVVTGVSEWLDQSGNNREFHQVTTSRQPAYNSGTGVVSFGGSHYIRMTDSIPNSNIGEIALVIRAGAAAGGVMWSKDSQTTIDADAFTFSRLGSSVLRFNKDVTASNESLSLTTTPDSTWMVVGACNDGSFANRNKLFTNGQEVAYTKQGIVGWASSVFTRMYLGAGQRNSGGVETTPIAFGTFDIVDFAMFDGAALNPIQRSRLIAYYRHEYSDLLV